MSVLDTIDYLKPSPGGAKLLIDDGINLSTVGGFYTSAWVDVTAFSGLFVQWNGFDLATDYGTLQVLFRDSLAGQVIEPTYQGSWRGDLAGAVNVPVLGAQAQAKVIGPAHGVNGQLEVTGHGGGPGTAVMLASDIMGKLSTGALAAGAGISTVVQRIREGAAQLHVETGTQPAFVYVQVFDSTGTGTVIGGYTVPAGTNDTRRVWIPPQPVTLGVNNVGGAVAGYNAALTSERS